MAQRLQFPAWSERKDHNSRRARRGSREARLSSRPASPAARSQWEGSVLHGVAGTALWTSCESRKAAGSSYYAVDGGLTTRGRELEVVAAAAAAGLWLRRRFRAALLVRASGGAAAASGLPGNLGFLLSRLAELPPGARC